MARSKVVMLVVTGMLIAGPLALAIGLATAHERTLEPKVTGTVQVASVDIAGKVRYPDGLTAVAQAPVRVWSAARREFVQEATTGRDGAYRLTALEPGDYQLVFADRVRVKLHVTAGNGAKVASLDVVIPHGQAMFAQMPVDQKAAVLTALVTPAATDTGQEPEEGSSSGLLPTLAIGAGGVTAVAVIADWGDDDNGRRRVNSP